MKLTFLLSAALLLFSYTVEAGHPEKNAEGFETIFDGTDLSKLETKGNWKIQEDTTIISG